MMKKFFLALTILLASPVWAGSTEIDLTEDYKQVFTTPSKNILCGGDSNKRKETFKWYENDLYCYVYEMKSTSKSCRKVGEGLDFALNRKGKPKMDCAGFEFEPFNAGEEQTRILQYGETVKGDGWSCTALKTGMRCQNDDGHGFLLNKTRYQFF